MEILILVGLFVLGLVILIFGADSLVRGASSIAKAYGLIHRLNRCIVWYIYA